MRIVFEYQRGVVFRLGRVLKQPKGPGLMLILWPIDRLVRVTLRTIVRDVPSQDVITRDNVSVKVNAVVYYRVVDPLKSVLEVEDFQFATSELSQTTLRSILGQAELDDLLAERERISHQLREAIDQQTDPWGIKVSAVEVKQVDLPDVMQRAMARQAESERDRRAKIIHAEGEFQASARLRDAAAVLEEHSSAVQLRFLQTVTSLGNEKSTIVVLPLPLQPFDLARGPACRIASRNCSASHLWREKPMTANGFGRSCFRSSSYSASVWLDEDGRRLAEAASSWWRAG